MFKFQTGDKVIVINAHGNPYVKNDDKGEIIRAFIDSVDVKMENGNEYNLLPWRLKKIEEVSSVVEADSFEDGDKVNVDINGIIKFYGTVVGKCDTGNAVIGVKYMVLDATGQFPNETYPYRCVGVRKFS